MMIPVLVLEATMRLGSREDPQAEAVHVYTLSEQESRDRLGVDWHPGENTSDVFEELAWEMLVEDSRRYAP